MVNNTPISAKSKIKNYDFSLFSFALTCCIFLIMILILVSPVKYANSVIRGLKLFFTSVLPGLLPFMFLTKLITELGLISKISKKFDRPMQKLFGLNGEVFYALSMSIISGYPIGSTIVADLYTKGKINNSQTTLASLISSTSGPIFVIGAVGASMLNSALLGVIIYVSNLAAVLISSFIMGQVYKRHNKTSLNAPLSLTNERMPRTEQNKVKVSQTTISNYGSTGELTKPKSKISLFNLVKETTISLLIVGFYIALFSLFIDLILNLKILTILSDNILGKMGVQPEISLGVMSGIIEMTTGAKMLSFSLTPLTISLIAFIIAFSGISIIMQSLSFLSNTNIKKGKFILGKLFQAILTFVICFVICSIYL